VALMHAEVYDAFMAANVGEEKARAAAIAIAGYDNRLNSIERRLDALDNNVQHLIMEVRIFGGILITLGASLGGGILWKVW
jgi:hypothetical protein